MKIIADKPENEVKLRAAFIKTLNGANNPKKNGSNPFTKSKYATLTDANDAVKSIAADNGLAITQDATNSEDGRYIIITTYLIHELGIIQFNPLKLPIIKNDPQGYGSTITYARRYALTSNLNLSVEDDDGNDGSQGYKPNYNNQNYGYNNNRGSYGNGKSNYNNRPNNQPNRQASKTNTNRPQSNQNLLQPKINTLGKLISLYAAQAGENEHDLIVKVCEMAKVSSLNQLAENNVDAFTKTFSRRLDKINTPKEVVNND